MYVLLLLPESWPRAPPGSLSDVRLRRLQGWAAGNEPGGARWAAVDGHELRLPRAGLLLFAGSWGFYAGKKVLVAFTSCHLL